MSQARRGSSLGGSPWGHSVIQHRQALSSLKTKSLCAATLSQKQSYKCLPVFKTSVPSSDQTQGYELQEDLGTVLRRKYYVWVPGRDALGRTYSATSCHPGIGTCGRAGPWLPSLPGLCSSTGSSQARAASCCLLFPFPSGLHKSAHTQPDLLSESAHLLWHQYFSLQLKCSKILQINTGDGDCSPWETTWPAARDQRIKPHTPFLFRNQM